MVVAKVEKLQARAEAAGLGVYGLAERLGVSHQTVRNMLAGEPVGGGTIAAVMALFPDLSFEDLFEVRLVAREGARLK